MDEESSTAKVPDRTHRAGARVPRADDRHVDLSSLKALAHPLRVRILEELSRFGPLTASGLGERLGESSGATSYHLRQLAKHDFVQEVEGKGSARERWWRRTPVGITLDSNELAGTPAGREAYDLVNREFHRTQEDALATFLARGADEFSGAWMSAGTVSTSNLRMTADELTALTSGVTALLDETISAYRDREVPPGARPVQLQFNAFPLVGGQEQAS
jgi:DNA-binding transcriptional ArsR family regulator